MATPEPENVESTRHDRDDDFDDLLQHLTGVEPEDPYRCAPLGSPYSDD